MTTFRRPGTWYPHQTPETPLAVDDFFLVLALGGSLRTEKGCEGQAESKKQREGSTFEVLGGLKLSCDTRLLGEENRCAHEKNRIPPRRWRAAPRRRCLSLTSMRSSRQHGRAFLDSASSIHLSSVRSPRPLCSLWRDGKRRSRLQAAQNLFGSTRLSRPRTEHEHP